MHSRVGELKVRFGSFLALGVVYDQEQLGSLLPDGGEAYSCTAVARYIIDREGHGRVVGYASGANPGQTATGSMRIGMGNTGHDLAVIDDRYIVDPWVAEVAETSERAVFDLLSPNDREMARSLYGDASTWDELDCYRRGSLPDSIDSLRALYGE